jgi:hypothetical protein
MAGWDSRVTKRPWVIISGNDARIARTNDFLEKAGDLYSLRRDSGNKIQIFFGLLRWPSWLSF